MLVTVQHAVWFNTQPSRLSLLSCAMEEMARDAPSDGSKLDSPIQSWWGSVYGPGVQGCGHSGFADEWELVDCSSDDGLVPVPVPDLGDSADSLHGRLVVVTSQPTQIRLNLNGLIILSVLMQHGLSH